MYSMNCSNKIWYLCLLWIYGYTLSIDTKKSSYWKKNTKGEKKKIVEKRVSLCIWNVSLMFFEIIVMFHQVNLPDKGCNSRKFGERNLCIFDFVNLCQYPIIKSIKSASWTSHMYLIFMNKVKDGLNMICLKFGGAAACTRRGI